MRQSFLSRRAVATEDDSEQMVPLINVVFLLMVFFLLAGTISHRDDLQIVPPKSSSERSRSPDALEIAVLADGRLIAAGQSIELAQLGDFLAHRFDGKVGLKLIRIELRADAALNAGALKPLLAALQQAGSEEVKLLTRRQ